MTLVRSRFFLVAVALFAPCVAVAQVDPSLASLSVLKPLTACAAGSVACAQTVTGRVSVDSCTTSDGVYGVGYSFTGTVGQKVTIRASSPSYRMIAALADGRSGNNTIYAQNQASSNGASAQISDFSLPFTGPYLIVLTPGTSFTFGDYSLTVTCGSTQTGACTAGTDRLCLLSNRFRITLSARDQRTGNVGSGQSIPQNDLYGIFSIPALTMNAANPEVFVKVIDGRPVNGRIWVFYGGLTDLEYTITVFDTQTSQQKTYTKEAGSTCGSFDTSAF